MVEDEQQYNRRKDDLAFAKFMGEIEQWKKETIAWRSEADAKLTQVLGFMEEIRTPRKIIIWTVRAIIIASLGSIATGVVAFVKGHIHFQ